MSWLWGTSDQLTRVEAKIDALAAQVANCLALLRAMQAAQTAGFSGLASTVASNFNTLLARTKAMSAELDALTAQVTANTDAEASAIQLLNNLHQMLVDAGTDPTKLTALADTLKTSGDALAAAIVANTPASP